MKRREFMAFVGGAAATWPLAVRAQSNEGIKRVAILMGGAENPETRERVAAFRQGLADRHWQDGGNLRIDIRWGMGDAARIEGYATELAKLAPDAILATNTPTARALKRATETVPIVFAGLSDPIGDGIVASLSQPGGNITGFTSFNAPIAGKWLELLKEISPSTQRAGVMYNPKTAPYAIFLPVMEAVAPQMGLTLTRAPVGDEAAIEAAISKLAGEPDAGLIVMPDIFAGLHSELIFALATRGRCRRLVRCVRTRLPVDCCPTVPISPIFFGKPHPISIACFAAKSPAICRCRSRPSTSLSSTSRPRRRSASPSRRRCWCAPTR